MNASTTGIEPRLIRRMAPWIGAIFFLIFLIATSIRVPAFQAPDEPIHFARSIEVAHLKTALLQHPRNSRIQGLLYVDLDQIYAYMHLAEANNKSKHDTRLLSQIESAKIVDLYSDDYRATMNLAHQMLGYTGVNYLPQALAIYIGEAANQSLSSIYNLGKFLQQLAGSVVFGFCLQAAFQFACWSGVLGCLLISLPMSLQLLSSFSGDAFVIEGAIILAILTEILIRRSWTANASKTLKISPVQAWEPAVGLSLLISYACLISKASYLPTALAQAATSIFYLRNTANSNQKQAKITSTILFGGITAISASMGSWLGYTTPAMRTLFETRLQSDVQLLRQHQVAHLSSDFLFVVVNTLTKCGQDLWNQMIGVLGSLDKPLTPNLFYWIISAFIALAILGSITSPGPSTIGATTPHTRFRHPRCMDVLTALVLLTGIAGSGYLVLGAVWTTWSSETSRVVEGLQGRHLMPLMPIIPVVTMALSRGYGCQFVCLRQNIQSALIAIITAAGTAVNFLAYFKAVNYWY